MPQMPPAEGASQVSGRSSPSRSRGVHRGLHTECARRVGDERRAGRYPRLLPRVRERRALIGSRRR